MPKSVNILSDLQLTKFKAWVEWRITTVSIAKLNIRRLLWNVYKKKFLNKILEIQWQWSNRQRYLDKSHNKPAPTKFVTKKGSLQRGGWRLFGMGMGEVYPGAWKAGDWQAGCDFFSWFWASWKSGWIKKYKKQNIQPGISKGE